MKAFVQHEIPPLAFFILILIFTPARAAQLQGDGQFGVMSTAKMLDCSGLPCVEISTAEGKHLKMSIDTGNPTSFISAKAAKELGLEQEPYRNAEGKEVPGVKIARLSGVTLGAGSLDNLKLAVLDLSEQMKNGTFPAVDGTLAYGVFKKRVLRLDYEESAQSVFHKQCLRVIQRQAR